MAFLIDEIKNKIFIPVGETSIGRGPLLKVIDRQVSRLHAVISFNNDQLSIKPVHKNPTFLRLSDEEKYIALKKDEWTSLSHGDSISLLPNCLLFTVEVTKDKQDDSIDTSSYTANIHDDNLGKQIESNVTQEQPTTSVLTSNKRKIEKEKKSVMQSTHFNKQKYAQINTETITSEQTFSKEKLTDPLSREEQTVECQSVEQELKTESNDLKKGTNHDPVLHAHQASTKEAFNITPTKSHTQNIVIASCSKEEENKQTKACKQIRVLPSWMTNSPSKQEASPKNQKKTKTEKVGEQSLNVPAIEPDQPLKVTTEIEPAQHMKVPTENSEDSFVVTPTNQSSSSGNNIASTSALDLTNKSVENNEEEKMENVKRKLKTDCDVSTTEKKMKLSSDLNNEKEPSFPVCSYGSQCYRKNPIHFQESSHLPSNEQDEDDSEKPECEYGTSCYRQNPQHRRYYKHTQDIKLSSPNPRRKRKPRKCADDDSDNDGEPNTYDYDDSFLNDDTDVDASISNDSDSHFVPDNNSDDEVEDVDVLVGEAQAFIQNKKMHK